MTFFGICFLILRVASSMFKSSLHFPFITEVRATQEIRQFVEYFKYEIQMAPVTYLEMIKNYLFLGFWSKVYISEPLS